MQHNHQETRKMRRTLFIIIATLSVIVAQAQRSTDKKAIMSFEKSTINVGTFPAEDPIKVCKFVFTNTGNADLYIHQAFASCGCTVPSYPEHAIKPGETDTIKVTYNGARKAPGHFRKSITIHNNSNKEMIKLYLTGKMMPAKEIEVADIEIEE